MVYCCGFCDGRLESKRFNNRPVYRATHARRCELGHTFPACEWCSRHTPCPVCGSSVARSMRLHPNEADSDDSDKEIADQVDVRLYPPRFCPAARVLSRVPYIWKPEMIVGWYVPLTIDCTGCSAPGPLFRVLFDVVMIYGGNTQSTSSSSSSAAAVVADTRPTVTERYRHKLCWRCAACVINRPLAIQAATAEERLTCFEIRPTNPLVTAHHGQVTPLKTGSRKACP